MQLQRRFGKGVGAAAGVAGALVATFAAPAPAGATPHQVASVQIVVKLHDPSLRASSVLSGLPGSTPGQLPGSRYVLQVPSGETAGLLTRLHADTRVAYASVSQTVHAATTPDDPCYSSSCQAYNHPDSISGLAGTNLVAASQTADLAEVGAPAAWAITHGSSNVMVAVLDSGVDANHPDLAGKVTVGPVICAQDDSLCQGVSGTNTDDAGHGTHVTGTIVAATDNAVGVASLGYDTRAEVFKVLDRTGAGTTTDLATGIYDAVSAGAQVINMSLSNDPCSVSPTNCGPDPDTEAAVSYAQSRGVVIVAAAGNEVPGYSASDEPVWPASYEGVLAVAATDNSGTVAGFSEYGDAANIAAPGVDIVSTYTSPQGVATDQANYATLDGTSMSTPHVAAAAALIRAVNPGLSGPQVVTALEDSASPVSANGPQIAGGELNAPAALLAATNPALPVDGYRMVGTDGSVYAFGADPYAGDPSGVRLAHPVVGAGSRSDGEGYWLAASDGGIFSYGDAAFFGSTGNVRLTRPIVGMAATPDGRGYWLVASDGGIFSFGDAAFFGSTGNVRLTRPIVGMAATPDGRGYWLVASDGGIFSFGDAAFFGSTGNVRLTRPIVGMAATPDGRGYWLVASDGGIFSFGDAAFFGSTGNVRLDQPIVGMQAAPTGRGYLLIAADGGAFTFGSVHFQGSLGGVPLPAPIIAITG